MTNKYVYEGNTDPANTTSILQVGKYAAKVGEVLPIPVSVLDSISNIFNLSETDKDISATDLNKGEVDPDPYGTRADATSPGPLPFLDTPPPSSADKTSIPNEVNGSGGGN